ncbi:hypothetical protein DIPPA_29897 [Diplonema papillatum]|nr:hypothetical protein DIPPA_29897 [Diplonema papillatum]
MAAVLHAGAEVVATAALGSWLHLSTGGWVDAVARPADLAADRAASPRQPGRGPSNTAARRSILEVGCSRRCPIPRPAGETNTNSWLRSPVHLMESFEMGCSRHAATAAVLHAAAEVVATAALGSWLHGGWVDAIARPAHLAADRADGAAAARQPCRCDAACTTARPVGRRSNRGGQAGGSPSAGAPCTAAAVAASSAPSPTSGTG